MYREEKSTYGIAATPRSNDSSTETGTVWNWGLWREGVPANTLVLDIWTSELWEWISVMLTHQVLIISYAGLGN